MWVVPAQLASLANFFLFYFSPYPPLRSPVPGCKLLNQLTSAPPPSALPSTVATLTRGSFPRRVRVLCMKAHIKFPSSGVLIANQPLNKRILHCHVKLELCHFAIVQVRPLLLLVLPSCCPSRHFCVQGLRVKSLQFLRDSLTVWLVLHLLFLTLWKYYAP